MSIRRNKNRAKFLARHCFAIAKRKVQPCPIASSKLRFAKLETVSYFLAKQTWNSGDIFELYIIHFDKQNYRYACSLACQIMSVKTPKEFYQNLFQMLYVRAHLKNLQEESLYEKLMNDFGESVYESWSNFEIGLVTTSELFNMLVDCFYRGTYGKYQIMMDFLAKYKHYLPTL